jgi:hypothetical protein
MLACSILAAHKADAVPVLASPAKKVSSESPLFAVVFFWDYEYDKKSLPAPSPPDVLSIRLPSSYSQPPSWYVFT